MDVDTRPEGHPISPLQHGSHTEWDLEVKSQNAKLLACRIRLTRDTSAVTLYMIKNQSQHGLSKVVPFKLNDVERSLRI